MHRAALFSVGIALGVLAACETAPPPDRVEFLGAIENCLIYLSFADPTPEGELPNGEVRGNVQVWRPGNQMQPGGLTGTRRGTRLTLNTTGIMERGKWEGSLVRDVIVLNVTPTPRDVPSDFGPHCPGGKVMFVKTATDEPSREKIDELLFRDNRP